MSEDAVKSVPQENIRDTYLETMIDCITQRNNLRVPIGEDPNIANLYGKANHLIQEFDKDISICKKYNQAKINRKYEIIINDLQREIKRLQDNLKLQQDARSPTKKHVSDILEKLVTFKNQNEQLQKENQDLKNKLRFLEDQLNSQSSAINKMQVQHAKSTIERLPPLNPSTTLLESVKVYLKDKEQVRKITKNPVSGLQKMLNQLKPKLWNWSIENLLEEIDKWSQGAKQKMHQDVDMWRIRSSIARKFSDYMDQPQSLIKPSVKSEETIWQKLQSKHHNKGKFSYVGSKRSLNASFH